MSCAVLCAFESPAATAHRAHSSPHEIFKMTTTRRTPAPARAAAPPSPPQQCLCGEFHDQIYALHWKNVEYVRLVEALVDPSVRDAFTVICEGRTRDGMDANTPDPWLSISNLYSSPSFKPDNRYALEHSHLADLDPGDPTKHHTRDAKKVNEKWGEMRKKLTTAVGNYEKSGQNDDNKSGADFTGGDLALEYVWRRLADMNMITDFGTKRLDPEAAAEDGSPPPDGDGGSPPPDDEDTGADPTPAPAPAPKRRRSAQRPATHFPPPPPRAPATEDDAFSAAMKTFMLQGIQLQQQALSKSAAQPEPNPASSDAGLQLAFAALRENLDDESRRLISEEIAIRVKAALQRDTPIQVD